MITKQVLRDAKTIISDPTKWHKGEGAGNARGLHLYSVLDPEATCWCSLGAIAKVLQEPEWITAQTWMSAAKLSIYKNEPIWLVNDTSDHRQVMMMFDDLIERAPA